MTATLLDRHTALPQIGRLGFTDGWQILPPTFLNLQLPVVIVDHAHIGDPYGFGLESFATMNPSRRPPATILALKQLGNTICIRQPSMGMIIASTHLDDDPALALIGKYSFAVIFVGSTYELESTWAALWSMAIGTAHIDKPGDGQ